MNWEVFARAKPCLNEVQLLRELQQQDEREALFLIEPQ